MVEDTKEVEVAAGESQRIIFTIKKDVAGTYSVDINGLAGSFMVKEGPATPLSWISKYWWTILAGVVAIGLIAFFVVGRKRRRAH